MNFLPMSYFICVVKCGGISPAAKELHITQQTLSAHMASLEKELGCTLFVRKPKFALTYAGERFLKYAREFCDSYQFMHDEFSDIKDSESGIVRVGVAHTRSRTIMPGIISAFQARYPFIQIVSVEQTNSRIIASLLAEERDVAIARCDASMPEVAAHTLYKENVLLVVSKKLLDGDTTSLSTGKKTASTDESFQFEDPSNSGNPEQKTLEPAILTELAKTPFFMSSEEDITGRIGAAFLRQHNLNPPIKAYSDNAATLLALCTEGLGACFCPDKLLYAALSDSQRKTVEIFPIHESYPIQIAHLKKAYRSRAARIFESFCIDYFASPTSRK